MYNEQTQTAYVKSDSTFALEIVDIAEEIKRRLKQPESNLKPEDFELVFRAAMARIGIKLT